MQHTLHSRLGERDKMRDSECMRIRLKPGMTERFVTWARQVPNRVVEVAECKSDQGILAEHIFLERSAEGDFITFYCQAEDMAKAREMLQKSRRRLDLEMIEMIDATWDRSHVSRLERIFEI